MCFQTIPIFKSIALCFIAVVKINHFIRFITKNDKTAMNHLLFFWFRYIEMKKLIRNCIWNKWVVYKIANKIKYTLSLRKIYDTIIKAFPVYLIIIAFIKQGEFKNIKEHTWDSSHIYCFS